MPSWIKSDSNHEPMRTMAVEPLTNDVGVPRSVSMSSGVPKYRRRLPSSRPAWLFTTGGAGVGDLAGDELLVTVGSRQQELLEPDEAGPVVDVVIEGAIPCALRVAASLISWAQVMGTPKPYLAKSFLL